MTRIYTYEEGQRLRVFGEKIAEAVKLRMDDLNLTGASLSELLFPYFDIKKETIKGYISKVRTNNLYEYYLAYGPTSVQRFRLATLLQTLGFEESDDVVRQVRNIDEDFIFPPKEIEQFDYESLETKISSLSQDHKKLIAKMVEGLLKIQNPPKPL